jgi:hypothetical protein
VSGILKCVLNKTVIPVFKKERKLKENERWSVYDQTTEVVDGISCLGVTLESTEGWTKHKTKLMARGKQTLLTIDKCLTVILDIKVKTLENV